MGVNDRETDKRVSKRDKAKAARSRRASASQEADYRTTDWICTVALVDALVSEGGALRLGVTRDGGAYALGVYLGDDYATEYIKPAEVWEDAIDEIARAWLPDKGEQYLERKIELRAQSR